MTIIYMHNDLEFVNTDIVKISSWLRQRDQAYDHESLARRAILCHIRSPCPKFCTRLYT